jgi:thioredoxin 2
MEIDERGIITTCPSCGTRNRLAHDRLGKAVRCARCKHALAAPAEPIEVKSTAQFDSLVAHAAVPVVVDYWAPWCGPCRMVAPELKKVATRQAGHVVVVKVNTDELTELGSRYGIRSLPTLAVFANGREVSRTAGARPAEEIERFIAAASASSTA